MKILVDIPDDTALHAFSLSLKGKPFSEFNLDEFINQLLNDYIADESSSLNFLTLAIERVRGLNPGDVFTLTQLLSDVWHNIEQPKSFGRMFKREALKLSLVKSLDPTSSNKSQYQRVGSYY